MKYAKYCPVFLLVEVLWGGAERGLEIRKCEVIRSGVVGGYAAEGTSGVVAVLGVQIVCQVLEHCKRRRGSLVTS